MSVLLLASLLVLATGQKTNFYVNGLTGEKSGQWLGPYFINFLVPEKVNYRKEKAMDYLKFYGYLPKTSKQSDESFIKALKLFQQWAHVKETGDLDNATWTMMEKERCGMPDVFTVSRSRRYVLQGSYWDKRLISYCIKSYPDETSFSKEDVEKTFAKSFKVWASVSTLKFQRLKKCPADIVIEFAEGEHGDGVPFDGRGGTLAHAYFPGNNGEGIYGDIHFDDAELWSKAKHRRGFENLFCTAVHEIGHSLGLRHTRKIGAAMWPWVHTCDDSPLSVDDINGIQALYGAPTKYPSFSRKPLRPSTLFGVKPTSFISIANANATNVIPFLIDEPTTNIPTDKTIVTFDLCDGIIDAITVAADGNTYGFRGSQIFLFTFTKVASDFPRSISSVFNKGPASVDAAVTVTHRSFWFPFRITYLFKDSTIWAYIFNNGQFVLYKKPTSILEELGVESNKIDAAFHLFRDDRFYLKGGNTVWEIDTDMDSVSRLTTKGSQSVGEMEELKGLPTFTAAFRWINGKMYFFLKSTYYRLERWLWFVQLTGPKSTAQFWFGCTRN